MKRHITTRAIALLMTMLMVLTSVPLSVLPVFASAATDAATTTTGEEVTLDGFALRQSEATLGKDVEYYALGDHMNDIVFTDGVVDDRISAYEPSGTTNSLDPFLIGGDAWINLDEIFYGAPAMPTYPLSAWSANTSAVNTTHFGMENGHWTYTFPDMNLIDETTWGNSLIKFDYNSGARGEETKEDYVSVEGVVSSDTAQYVSGHAVDVSDTKVVAKNGLAAYTYNRYDDMQAKWGITMDKNTKSVTFTPANRDLFLSKTPYLYFSNEQTPDTKMAISLLIGTPVIDTTAGIVNGVDVNKIADPGVVHVYEALSSSVNNTNPGRTGDEYYAMLEIGDAFKTANDTITYIKDQATLDSITAGLTTYTVDGQSANVRLYQNQTQYKKNADGSYVYEYKWYTVTDSAPHPGVENSTMDNSMTPSITVSEVATADGKVNGADYVVPETGYVTGALTGCIDFTHILDIIYSTTYLGVKYDVAKVRVDMADVDTTRKTAGRINYLYFAPACEDTFTPQVSTGVVESTDNAIAEGWENGATVTITDTPNNPQKITIDTTGDNVYYDNEVDVKYMLYLQKYVENVRNAAPMTEAEYAAANGYTDVDDYNKYITPYTAYLLAEAQKGMLPRSDFGLSSETEHNMNYENYVYNLLWYMQGWRPNDWYWFEDNMGGEYAITPAGFVQYLEDEVDKAWKDPHTRDGYKAANPDQEDIDYVTIKIPVRKYINSLSDARKFTMTVDVLSWVTADGQTTTNPSQSVKKSNGEIATPTIMLWGSKNGSVGAGRSYWNVDEAYRSLNYGCRFANDGMLAVLGNGVYLAEPRYWYESASVDRTLGNSTDYDGHESWYDLLRSPYMYDETITSASNIYPEEMVGYVYVTNMTVCIPKGMVVTVQGARCSGNSAGMNMQDDIGDVVNAYDGGSGVNPVVNENLVKGETNLTGTVVEQSGVNFSEKPAAYGPYLTFSDYTIGDLIDTGANTIYGKAFRDYSGTGNDPFHDAIYPMPKATYGNITYSYSYNGSTVTKTASNKPLGKIYTESSSAASYMVYATVYFKSTGQKFGAVGVIRDTVQTAHDGDKSISDIGWVCLRTQNSDGSYKYLAEECDYRSTVYTFGEYETPEAFLGQHPQWKQELREFMLDKWVYSDLAGYGGFRYYDGDGNAYGYEGKDSEYLTNDKAPDGNMLVEDYWLVDANGSSLRDDSNNYQWRYAPTLFNANQWRGLSGANTYYQVSAYKNGALKPGTPGHKDGNGNYYFSDTELYDGVHNFELTWPYEYSAVTEEGVDHRGQSGDVSEFRAKLKADAQTSLGLTRTLKEPILVRVGSTSGSMPALHYDIETTAGSANIGILVAMPRTNAYGNVSYDDIQLWYINPSTNTLKKSIPNKNFLGDGSTNSNTTHYDGDQDSARDNFSGEANPRGYISLADLLDSAKGGSTTDRCYIVGVTQSMWHGQDANRAGQTVKTTIRRLEVLYEKDAWLDDINYGTVSDFTTMTNSQLNNRVDLIEGKTDANQDTPEAAINTTFREDGTILLERTAAMTGANMGLRLDINKAYDTSVYRYLNLTINAEVPFVLSWFESGAGWYSTNGTFSDKFTFTNTISGSKTAVVPGQYQISLDLQSTSIGKRSFNFGSMYVELHGTGKVAISELALSKTAGSSVPMPMIDEVYDHNVRQSNSGTRTLVHDSYNVLNDVFYYNQTVDTVTAEMTINDTGKRGWNGEVRTHGNTYYSNGTDTDASTTLSQKDVIKNGGIDGVYQYKTSLGHVRLWMDPNSSGSLVLNCDRTWDIRNYRYLYYSYSMRDDDGLAVEDDPNGSGVQLVLKTSMQNNGAAFVDQGDTWEYHTNYDSILWGDGDTDWTTNNHGKYGISLGSGRTNEFPSKVNRCQCSKCLDYTGAAGEPEHTYNVSANVAVDLYDVYNQEKAASGAKNYATLTEATPSEAAETAINQIVFYIKNTKTTEAEFYINYIYLSNTPISDEMQPIFEMEEHQFYYMMDNTGTRYSARFPTLDNPTGQITGTTDTNRNQNRNNPVVVVRGDILDDAMFSTGQGFKDADITDYRSMMDTDNADEAFAAGKLYLKDDITMTEAVWFYENHFPEKIDGVQAATPDTDILDYYKYVHADGSDGDVYDLQWSLGRWYVSDGTDGLNVMKKDEATAEVTGNLMKRYAVDNRVLLRTGIRPRTYTTYYDTQGGEMTYSGSSESIVNGTTVNENNYYITESPLNFFYTWPVDGGDVIEPTKPGYDFIGWTMISDHGSVSPGTGNDLRNYHLKDVAQVDYYQANWAPKPGFETDDAKDAKITATFFRTEDGMKRTLDTSTTEDFTWFTRSTSWRMGYKITLPSASIILTPDGYKNVYGWKMVTYDEDTKTVTETGKVYDLGAKVWLTENAYFLPSHTPINTDDEGNPLPAEQPTVTITMVNASLWTYVNGQQQSYVTVTGASQSINGNTITYTNVPRNVSLIAIPAGRDWVDNGEWRIGLSGDNANQISNTGSMPVISTNGTFVFSACADYTLSYTKDTGPEKAPVVSQTIPTSYVANRELRIYSQFTVEKDSGATVVAHGTIYTKAGSAYNSIKANLDANMRLNESTINATSVAKGSFQTVNTSNVRHVMGKKSELSQGNQYYMMTTISGDKTSTYYARSYAIYTTDGGKTYKVAYGDAVVSATVKAATV